MMSAPRVSAEEYRRAVSRAIREHHDPNGSAAGVLAGVTDFLEQTYGPRVAAELLYQSADDVVARNARAL